MLNRSIIHIALGSVLALAVGPAHGFEVDDRWTFTATDGSTGSTGTPITVTWGIVADGTTISGTEGTSGSDLIDMLDTTIGAGIGGSDLTLRPWFEQFTNNQGTGAFDRLGQISGVTYVYEPNDSGQAIDNTSSPFGLLNVRPDIRIGGHSVDGSSGANTLAYNYFPNHGDMVLDTDNASFYGNAGSNFRRLRNVLMHETIHGLGLGHVESNNASFLMEPFISTGFDGPQLDDILGLQRNYGDALEKNGGNNSHLAAYDLGSLSDGGLLQIGTNGDSTFVSPNQSDFISIHDDSDIDYFSFSVNQTLEVSLDLLVRGATYNQGPEHGSQTSLNTKALSDLSLTLFDSTGLVAIESADFNGLGAGETIMQTLAAGTYHARVAGANDNVQLYGLNIAGYIPPTELLWTGAVNSDWNIAGAANWTDGGPTTFADGNEVTFDDTASRFTVNITENVEPFAATVDTDGTYVFTGPGAIVGGALTKRGTGTLELANDGNTYSDDTDVQAGTLLITGNADAMVSTITIHNGATVVMDSSDASSMDSEFVIHVGGTLQIGRTDSSANVFPDSPSPITNDGTIIVHDAETVANVSGTGQIIAQQAQTFLRNNAAFAGSIIVNHGAQANVNDANAFGSFATGTTVNDGGQVVFDLSATFSEPFDLAGDGGGDGALTVTNASTVLLNGAIAVNGTGTQLNIGAGSTLTIDAPVTSTADGDLTIDTDGTTRMNMAINLGNGGLTKTGTGSAQLYGTANYTGTTHVTDGTLIVTGSTGSGSTTVHANARLEGDGTIGGQLVGFADALIHPTGTLAVADGYTAHANATLELHDLGGANAGQLDVVGNVQLAGALDLMLAGDASPTIGDVYDLIPYTGTRSGMFDSITGMMLGDVDGFNAALAVTYGPSVVAARVSILGDANFDDRIDATDLALLAANWQSTGDWTSGDFNGDGFVDLTDLGVIATQWQVGVGAASPASFSAALAAAPFVPEPSTAVLLFGLGGAAICRRPMRDTMAA